MLYRLAALTGSLLLLATFVLADDSDSLWPATLVPCPSFVHLVTQGMTDIDGRKHETLRFRPWPDAHKKIQHSDLVVENISLHHFLNNKALMVSTGSPDQPRVHGQIASFKSVVFRNLDIGPVRRTTAGLHMDHLWIGAGHDHAFRPNVTFQDIFIHDGCTGAMPILFEAGGNWGTLTIQRVALANVPHPIMIKLGSSTFKSIVIEDSPGIHVDLQGDPASPVTVYIHNCPGANIGCPPDANGRMSKGVTFVNQ
jgi:hypothetical protein